MTPDQLAYIRRVIEDAHASQGLPDHEVVSVQTDGARAILPLDQWLRFLNTNHALYRQCEDFRRASEYWCWEARRLNRLLRATIWMAVGLIAAGGLLHLLLCR